MPTQTDLVSDVINKPLLAIAGGVVVLGFFLTITIALMPIGVVLMALGAIWAAAIFGVALIKVRTDRINPYEATRHHP